MIEFINSVNLPFVAFTLVCLGTICILAIGLVSAKGSKQQREFQHTENMTRLPMSHDEAMAKWEYEKPKQIEGKAIEHHG